MRRRVLLPLLLAALGCTRTEQVSGVVVQVLSDLEVPEQLDAVTLQVELLTGGTRAPDRTFSLDPGAQGHVALPLNYGLYPQEGKGSRFRVTALGLREGGVVVSRSATLSFPDSGPTVLLQLPLLAACNGTNCKSGETCLGAARCLSDDVIVAELTPYSRGAGGGIVDQPDARPPAPDTQPRDTSVTPPPPDAALDVAAPPTDLAPDLMPPPPDLAEDIAPICVPRPEECFNGLDEDCDQLIDCADPDCGPMVAQCVPVDPMDNGTPGVTVAANATCPAGFNQAAASTIHTGVTGMPCSGCSCGAAPATCAPATILSYASTAACMTDTTNTAGDPVVPPTLSAADGCKTPNYVTAPGGLIYGMRIPGLTPMLGGCAPMGMATRGPITWAATLKFCPTIMRGVGCPQGQVCVPRAPTPPAQPRACVSYPSARACPTGMSKLQNADWYMGATDNRTCGACTCAAPTGGSCANLYVHVGNDYTCNPNTGDVGIGKKVCFGTSYSPGLQLHGAPTAGTCAASSNTAGPITPTGRRTVCCL